MATRRSSYDIYPASTPILGKFSTYIATSKFRYSIQLSSERSIVPHPIGSANLFFAWAGDGDISVIGSTLADNDLTDYNNRGKLMVLPYMSYYWFNTGADPKFPVYELFPSRWFYVISNRNNFYIRYTANYGGPGDTYRAYVHIVMFNDSFSAPFIKPEVL